MIRDTIALTSLTAGFYAIWCATPGDADAAERAQSASSFGGEFGLICLAAIVGWLIVMAIFPPMRRAPPADDAPDERTDVIEQRARETQS
jgi:hypothetical protein